MKAHRTPLQTESLTFDAQGRPASTLYDDAYHGHAGALAQAHHVFLRGNGLPERWAGRDSFTICETGFGLGNNFLALWQAWRASPQRPRRLHLLSFEAHPLSREDLAAALAAHEGELRYMADALLRAWPILVPGLHRLEFEEGRLTLTLAFGRVEYLARQVEARVDAFFLDGFAPDRNPAMWSRALFGQLVRLANQGATAATWCSAGQVRRDLAAAGFVVERIPGIAGKRQISCATLRPGLGQAVPSSRRDSVLVIGGGLAGAATAHSLALRGHAVTVLDPAFSRAPAGTHEGHRCAAMTPTLSLDDNFMSRLSRAGILLAGLRWPELGDVSRACGSLLKMASDDAGAWRESLDKWKFPPDWASWCEGADTASQCGLALPEGGVWLPQGRLVRPVRVVRALMAGPGIEVRAQRVAALERHAQGWQALSEGGGVLAQADRLVLAAGPGIPDLLTSAFPERSYPKLARLQRMGGQVAYFRAGSLPSSHAIVAGAGYWLPPDEGVHVGGSTYEFDQAVSEPSEAGFRAVAEKVADLLGVGSDILKAARAQPDGWAGWRVALSDHLPVMGPVDPEETVWVAGAYGSRGLSWMTLAAECLAARLNGEPQVLERELLKAVRPR